MKKIFFNVCLVFLFFESMAQPAWQQLNDFPIAGTFSTSFTTSSAPYVVRGYEVYKYNPANDSWEQKNNLPSSIALITEGFEYNGIGYVFGREDTSEAIGVIWEYDEAGDTWSIFESHDFGNFGLYDLDASVFVDSTKAYFLTSTGGENFRSYDFVTNTWEVLESYPQGIVYDTRAVSTGGRHFIIFVNLMPGLQRYLYEYNVATDSWISRPEYIGPIVDWFPTAVFGIDSFIYAGIDDFGTGFYRYDLTNDIWLSVEAPQVETTLAASFAFNGKGYVVGGNDWEGVIPVPVDAVWEFSPELLSIDENSTTKVFIYPNPAKQEINWVGPHLNGSYQIRNLEGQLIQNGVVSNEPLDVSSLSSGLYFLSIKNKEGVQIEKFLKL